MDECSFDDIQEFLADVSNSDNLTQNKKSENDLPQSEQFSSVDTKDFFPVVSDDEEDQSSHLENASTISENNSISELVGFAVKNTRVSYKLLSELFWNKKKHLLKNLKGNFNSSLDWLISAIITYKSPPKNTSAGKPFWVWKLSDLEPNESNIILFMFSLTTEQSKLPLGSLISVLNPEPMNKRSKEDSPTFGVNNYKKVLYVGKSADYGICKGVKAKGGNCQNAINRTHGEFCAHHVQKHYKKMSSNRPDLQCKMSGFISRRDNKKTKEVEKTVEKPQKRHGGLSFDRAVCGFTETVSQRTKLLMSPFSAKDETVTNPAKVTEELPRLNRGKAGGRVVLEKSSTSGDIFGAEWQNMKNAKPLSKSATDRFEDIQLNCLFRGLADREHMEDKMSAISEKKCKVVTCAQCKYTAMSASNLCRKLGHVVSRHEAVMLYFSCRNCSGGYTQCFAKYPLEACRVCKAVSWRRDSMLSTMKRKVVKNDDVLKIT